MPTMENTNGITSIIIITIICMPQGRTAANALKLVALTVKQKCL